MTNKKQKQKSFARSMRLVWCGLVAVFILAAGLVFNATYASTWALVYSEDFNGGSLDMGAWSMKTGTENHHQGVYATGNVSVHDGSLDLLTQRNCVPPGGSPNSGNASTGVCPGGTTTKYSSGKIISTNRWPNGRIEVRATLPAAQNGLWPAIWMRQQSGWGSSTYGELDMMEWYGDQPKLHTSTSIMGASAVKAHHNLSTGTDLSTNGPHTYAMEWSTSGITYYFDGTKLNSSPDVASTFSGIASDQFQSIMSQTWELRLETEVSKVGGPDGHTPPDDNATFNPAHFLIDSVKIYTPVAEPASGGESSGGAAGGQSSISGANAAPTAAQSGDTTNQAEQKATKPADQNKAQAAAGSAASEAMQSASPGVENEPSPEKAIAKKGGNTTMILAIVGVLGLGGAVTYKFRKYIPASWRKKFVALIAHRSVHNQLRR